MYFEILSWNWIAHKTSCRLVEVCKADWLASDLFFISTKSLGAQSPLIQNTLVIASVKIQTIWLYCIVQIQNYNFKSYQNSTVKSNFSYLHLHFLLSFVLSMCSQLETYCVGNHKFKKKESSLKGWVIPDTPTAVILEDAMFQWIESNVE